MLHTYHNLYGYRWPDVVPLNSISAKSVAEALISIFGRTGLPLQLLSDNGTQFTGTLVKELSELFGIEMVKITISQMEWWSRCMPHLKAC